MLIQFYVAAIVKEINISVWQKRLLSNQLYKENFRQWTVTKCSFKKIWFSYTLHQFTYAKIMYQSVRGQGVQFVAGQVWSFWISSAAVHCWEKNKITPSSNLKRQIYTTAALIRRGRFKGWSLLSCIAQSFMGKIQHYFLCLMNTSST